MRKIISNSVEETLKIAAEFGRTVSIGDVICLYGELGSGKTHFVKGFVKAFGIPPESVQSPTFTIINEYGGEQDVYHFDCYRLEKVEEALEIGAEEYFYGGGVCIIEWPDRIAEILPANCKKIFINSQGPESREIIFHDVAENGN